MEVKDIQITRELTEEIFLEEGTYNKESKKFLLRCFTQHVLYGMQGITDEEGNKLTINFTKGKTFTVPVVPFADFENGSIDIDELMIYIYLCYVVHNSKSSNVKVRVDMISKRTGLSKTKIKDGLNSLRKKKNYLTDLGKQMVNVELISDDVVAELELAKELIQEHSQLAGEVTNVPIPTEWINNYQKYGFTPHEFAILELVIIYAYSRENTYEEIVKGIMKIYQEPSKSYIEALIKKAENHDFFKLIELDNGCVKLTYENESVL